VSDSALPNTNTFDNGAESDCRFDVILFKNWLTSAESPSNLRCSFSWKLVKLPFSLIRLWNGCCQMLRFWSQYVCQCRGRVCFIFFMFFKKTRKAEVPTKHLSTTNIFQKIMFTYKNITIQYLETVYTVLQTYK